MVVDRRSETRPAGAGISRIYEYGLISPAVVHQVVVSGDPGWIGPGSAFVEHPDDLVVGSGMRRLARPH